MNDKLPTRDEIRQLPCWAQVAFATRCARRVQPLFALTWPDAPEQHLRVIDHAICVAERAAARAARADTDARGAAAAADDTAAVADADAATYATYAAAAAADAARAAAYAYADAATYAAAAARAATYAARVTDVIRTDFDLLLRRSREKQWTDDTPVPPSVFGPMWPEGKPPWEQPADTPVVAEASPKEDIGKRFKLILQAEVEEGTPPEEVRQKMVELYRSLNEYSLAKYGKGLSVDEFKRYLAVGVEVRP